jgi:hypothetical protein
MFYEPAKKNHGLKLTPYKMRRAAADRLDIDNLAARPRQSRARWALARVSIRQK